MPVISYQLSISMSYYKSYQKEWEELTPGSQQ